MPSNSLSPNQREILSARSTVTGHQEYLSSTNNILNVNATVSISGVATADNQTNGDQKTQIVDAGGDVVTVTGGKLDVNATISGAGGGTSSIDNTIFAVGSDSGTPIMGIYQASASSVTDGDVAVAGLTVKRAIKVNLQTAAGVELTNTSNALDVNLKTSSITLPVSLTSTTITGTVAATQSGTWNIGTVATLTNALPAGSNVIGHVIADSGSTTAVTGNVTVVQSTASSLKATVIGAGAAGTADAGVVTIQGITSMTPILATATQSGTWNIGTVTAVTAITNALPAGSNVIGHVIADSGSTTAVTQATAASLNATVVGTGTFAVQNTPANPTTVLNGKTTVTTAGTRVVLASSTACKSVTIKALSTNTGFIYIGDTSVAASNGFQLSAGDTVSLDIANLTTVNLDCSVNGEGVTYLGVN